MFASIISMEGVSRRSRLRVVVYAVNLRRMQRTYVSRTQSAPFRHGGIAWAPRVRLSVSRRTQNAPFRDVAAPRRCGTTPRQAAGHYGKRPNWANALEQPPPPACGAACVRVRRSRFGVWPHGKAHSARPAGFRMRFFVMHRPQTVLFRYDPHADCVFP